MVPEAILQPLQRADGSASYSYHGYSVIAAVNGPVEVQRRDELPEEAAVEVIIRPTVGVGGIRAPSWPWISLAHALQACESVTWSPSFTKPFAMSSSPRHTRER
jgi:exosome complex component RRP46